MFVFVPVLLVVLVLQVGAAGAERVALPRNRSLPIVSGLALQGQTLSASTGSWSETPTRYVFSWSDCDSSGTSCAIIAAASAAKLTLLARDVGHTIRVAVTAVTNTGPTTAQSAPTTVVRAPPVADVTAPSVPSGLSLGGVGQSAVTLSWAASSDNVGVTGYRLYRGGSQIGTSLTRSYLFSGLVCATSYTLGVAALDGAGNVSSPATVTVTTSACSSPPLGGTSVANVWVGVGGSGSCVRSPVAVGYAAAVAAGNVCDSGPTAYVRAQLGDTVLIEGGTYTSQWNFTAAMSKTGTVGTCDYNYPGTPNLSGCVSFRPASGQSVIFQVGGGAGVSQIRVCANFISIQNITIAMTTYTDSFNDTVSNGSIAVGAGDNSCLPGGGPPHDLYFANNNYGGQAGAVGGASNVWFVGGTATGTSDFPWQMGGQGNNGATSYANHNGIVGMTFQGYNFANSDSAHHHMECIHDTPGSDHITIAGNRILNCPVESFFAQGTTQTNILVENNYFDTGGPLKFDCTTNPGCVNQNITVRYNSFHATALLLENACNVNNTCAGATIDNNHVYANIGDGCPTINFGLGGSTGSGWTSGGYNVETVTRQGICTSDTTSAYNQTITYASPGAPTYNLDLNGTQTATGYVPALASRPATDLYGNIRPAGVSDAGADER